MAPIHVWQPAPAVVPSSGRIALAPVAGNRELARRIESAMLAQRPAARADVALFTAEQLAQISPVRLTSTAPLTSELLAIQAARVAGADVLLQGEILSMDITLEDKPAEKKPINMNQAFFQRREDKESKEENLVLSWRVIDVSSARTLTAQSLNFRTKDAIENYPDLAFIQHDRTDILITASARETWKSISPHVIKEKIRLATPWLQPGAYTVRRGAAAARTGQWEQAEQHWSRTAKTFPFNAAAHHNLALAYAAREDFPAAKQQLQKATGIFAFRLPNDTLYWLDQKHRLYNEAHGFDKPAEGWAFPEPNAEQVVKSVEPIDVASLPWWTAIPLAKPPGWTWQGWLTQPWTL